MKCIKCSKEFVPVRKTGKFCSDSCRVSYNRLKVSVTGVVPVTVTKDTLRVSVTKKAGELIFTTETPKERVAKYKEFYPDSVFVPNWVAHNFNSKEEAIRHAISEVKKSQGVINAGFDYD